MRTLKTKTVQIKSREILSEKYYEKAECPDWWVRYGKGRKNVFVDIAEIPATEQLDVEIEVLEKVKEVFFGCGPKDSSYGIRDSVNC